MSPQTKSRPFQICDIVRETAFAIHRCHGPGHLERIYESALVHRLRKQGLSVEQQVSLKVFDEDRTLLGDLTADVLVEGILHVELKAVRTELAEHVAHQAWRAAQLRCGQVSHQNVGHVSNTP